MLDEFSLLSSAFDLPDPLSQEEMIDYYTSLAHKYGGKLTSKWVYGMVATTRYRGCKNFVFLFRNGSE